MRWLVSLALFLASNCVFAQTKFPTGPTPLMAVTPGSVIVVTSKQICVVEGDKDFFLKASPSNGSIKITKDTGPITYKGEFPDQPGKTDVKRIFKGPFLYEVSGVGDVELFSIPVGVTDEKLILSQAYSFVSNAPPDPEPNPPNPPTPKPGTKTFWLVLVEETADRTGPGLINDKAYWDSKVPHQWMAYDQSTSKGQKYKAACDKLGVKLPACVFVDQKAVAPATPLGAVSLTSPTAKVDVDAYLAKLGGK